MAALVALLMKKASLGSTSVSKRRISSAIKHIELENIFMNFVLSFYHAYLAQDRKTSREDMGSKKWWKDTLKNLL